MPDPKDSIPEKPTGTSSPGDEASPGTPGSGENICRSCAGTGRRGDAVCPECGGTGKVIEGIGGG
jgi:hypothetical protein